jgi:hypothetical protein
MLGQSGGSSSTNSDHESGLKLQRGSDPAEAVAQGHESGVSPLALDGWLEFNRLKWNVRPLKIRVPGPDAAPPVARQCYTYTRAARCITRGGIHIFQSDFSQLQLSCGID